MRKADGEAISKLMALGAWFLVHFPLGGWVYETEVGGRDMLCRAKGVSSGGTSWCSIFPKSISDAWVLL